MQDYLTPFMPLESSRCVVFCRFSLFKSIYLAPWWKKSNSFCHSLEITWICQFSLLDSLALLGYLTNEVCLHFVFKMMEWLVLYFFVSFIISSVIYITIPNTKVKKSYSINRPDFCHNFSPLSRFLSFLPNIAYITRQ